MLPNLRPGATAEQIATFERAMDLTLPVVVRESWLIHDGQDEFSYPGAIVGEPLSSLSKMRHILSINRELAREIEQGDAACEFASYCSSQPPDAIRQQSFNAGWLPLGDWDGNSYGIDFDPGPNGVVGQVINFGRNEEAKYVLALSWAHFLEDVADELESGVLVIERDAGGDVVSFGRPGHDDQAMFRFYREWSQAKLPASFQNVEPVIKLPAFPGELITGLLADEARQLVADFLREMHECEQFWLEVRPLAELGYAKIIQSPSGHQIEGLPTATTRASIRELQLQRHRQDGVSSYQQIVKKYATDRRRAKEDCFIQQVPPYYSPAENQLGDVRELHGMLYVYAQSNSGVTKRFQLLSINGSWKIDLLEKSADQVQFEKVSLYFGTYA
ncbi:SMI1/KNR4 family protein [Anatilimnocola floriformis]|uniref:SMI1/KNR4 family protein n=1 Tax=Anatilimnocola floriformis TaxID=2948575 RepID=UPI0020C3AD92|nr:SMI1/KNR4 family protein [Anatilimnocola floriformis]